MDSWLPPILYLNCIFLKGIKICFALTPGLRNFHKHWDAFSKLAFVIVLVLNT